MPKVIINGKVFDIKRVDDQGLITMIEKTGAKEEIKINEKLEVKELSVVDPYTIGIGIGAVITWIIYRVSQSQKSEFKDMFEGKLK